MIDLQPTICNICGGKVEYIPNYKIYGKSYGSGWCYHCKDCDAYVGTHKPRPKEALGLLANEEMRNWKQWCHREFDKLWSGGNVYNKEHKIVEIIKPIISRKQAYSWLAKEMKLSGNECHFGYFNINQLKQAYAIIKNKTPTRR